MSTGGLPQGATVKIFPVPIQPPECLPEGRKFLVVDIDWAQIPVLPLAAASPYIDLPEVTITDNSADGPGMDNSLDGYQVIEFSLQSVSNAASLSQCVALQYHWRPQWGNPTFSSDPPPAPNGDFCFSSSEQSALYVTCPQRGITVNIPCASDNSEWEEVSWIIDGCFPFYALPNDTIRMVRLFELAESTPPVGSGRGTFIFSNFAVPPFCVRTIATGDNP